MSITTYKRSILIVYFFNLFAFILGLSIYYIFSFFNTPSKQLPGFVPPIMGFVLTGILSWTIVKDVIEGEIKNDVETDQREDYKKLQKSNPNEIVTNQEKEFLYLLQEVLGSLNKINFTELSPSIHQEVLKGIDLLKEKLREFKEDTDAREKAVKGLSDEQKVIMPIVREAADNALGRNINDRITPEIESFYDDIYAFLKAWLICSIKYNYPMPINPIRRTEKDKHLYIEALKCVKKLIETEKMKQFLPNSASQKIVKKYLNILIESLKD